MTRIISKFCRYWTCCFLLITIGIIVWSFFLPLFSPELPEVKNTNGYHTMPALKDLVRDLRVVVTNEPENHPALETVETKIVDRNPGKTYTYTAMIVEPRNHPALEFVIDNFAENLDENWQFVILHGRDNVNLVEKIAEKHSGKRKCTLVKLSIPNLTTNDYNRLLLRTKFYTYIPTEMFLVFQADSLLNPNGRHLLAQFLSYDYVGGPWANPPVVGTGDLSLRRKSKMLEIIEKCETERMYKQAEDLFFSLGCKLASANKPPPELAKQFAICATYSPDFFGVHKPWKLLGSRDDYAKLVNDFPLLEKLKKLNSLG